jgi:YfiH family protein
MTPPPHPEAKRIREPLDDHVGALVHPIWAATFPWLVQGTTTRGASRSTHDFGLFSGGSPDSVVQASWDSLLSTTEMGCAVHARQIHEADVCFHEAAAPGLRLVDPCDGHATDEVAVLLAVSTADCVPIFLVDPEARAVAVLHAGWRGAAAGILERGLDTLGVRSGTQASDVHMHLGPAICGSCYEVGPEVFAALGLPAPESPHPIDLRGVLVGRAVAMGIDPAHVTTSAHCTLCTESGLYSHRGGDKARQVGYLGIRL